MSGKTGSRPTGRKPATVRRQSAKTDGASEKRESGRWKATAAIAIWTRLSTRRSPKAAPAEPESRLLDGL